MAASPIASGVAFSLAKTQARSTWAAAITAMTSSMCVSSGSAVPGASGSDSPMPRRSTAITRANEPSRRSMSAISGMSQFESRLEKLPLISRISRSPLPNVWKAMWTPSAVFA